MNLHTEIGTIKSHIKETKVKWVHCRILLIVVLAIPINRSKTGTLRGISCLNTGKILQEGASVDYYKSASTWTYLEQTEIDIDTIHRH